ncbi:MAG: hypothetical protein IPG42_16515 [Betaproteobacteria bacterium]|nr:hypothetical protein [Betaproteobacteria bacterium]
MSMTLWLNIRDGEHFKSNEEDHSAVFYLQESLDEMASSLGVSPLSAFYDDTDLRYNMDESGEFDACEEGWPASAAKWFPAAAVQASVSAILSHLQTHPMPLRHRRLCQSDAMEELRDFQSTLTHAVAEPGQCTLCHWLIVNADWPMRAPGGRCVVLKL